MKPQIVSDCQFSKSDVLFSKSLVRQTLAHNFRTRKNQSWLHYTVINDDAPYFCTIDQNLIVYHKSQKLLVPVDIKKDPLYCTLDSTQSSPLGQKVSEWACWAKIINLGRILLLRMLLALEKMAFVSPWRSQFRCCEKYMYYWWSLLPTLCLFVASIKKWTIQTISYHSWMRNNYKINS